MAQEIRYAREVGYNMGQDYCDTSLYMVKGRKKGRRSLGKPSRPAQEELNNRNARMHFTRLCNANFGEDDYVIHLTFDPENLPESRKACKQEIDKFLRRVKRAWERAGQTVELRYLYVIEGSDGKRLHAHMLMTKGLPRKLIKELWGLAEIVNVDDLQAGKTGFDALGKYLTKQGRLADGEHRWYGSRTLCKPDKAERNAHVPMDEIAELGEYIANEMAVGAGFELTEERLAPIEARYPGYYCADAEAKYLETFREWVVHIKLFRKDTLLGIKETERRKKEKEKLEEMRRTAALSFVDQFNV